MLFIRDVNVIKVNGVTPPPIPWFTGTCSGGSGGGGNN